jgi:hypothetical protein
VRSAVTVASYQSAMSAASFAATHVQSTNQQAASAVFTGDLIVWIAEQVEEANMWRAEKLKPATLPKTQDLPRSSL